MVRRRGMVRRGGMVSVGERVRKGGRQDIRKVIQCTRAHTVGKAVVHPSLATRNL